MQIELIAPASEDSTFLPRMGLGILAALTPASDQVVYTDDLIRPFDVERDLKDVDLVGISVDSKTARRSYEIAAAYRRRGVKVVLGGIHPTALPGEASRFADAVVVGEAEDVWPRLLGDFKRHNLARRYDGAWPALGGRPFARRDLFRSRKYIPFHVVQTMRGCPYPCEFCSVSTANGSTMRTRPVDEVIAELRTLGKYILFADDNVMIHRRHSAELLSRMADLGKRWIGQCSLAAVRRIENIELMARSGCLGLFIGFESIDEETLRLMGKRQNHAREFAEVVQHLRERGLATWGSFVFGFDTDDAGVFERTAQFAIDTQMTMASFAILTPYPGTKLYRRLAAEGRLTDPRWWLRSHHDACSPYFVPRLMTPTQLHDGWQRAWQILYSARAIWKRWPLGAGASWIESLAYLPLNLMQNRLVRRKIVGGRERFRSAPQKEASGDFERLIADLVAAPDPAADPI